MNEGQPLTLKMLLPQWLSVDDFYLIVAALVAFLCILGISAMFAKPDPMASKIKAIQERRNHLREETLSPGKRKRPEKSVTFMRAVANKLQLVKKSQIGKTQQRLIEAGFRTKDAIYVLAFFNLVLPIIGCIIGIFIMNAIQVAPKWRVMNWIWPVLVAYIGMKLPGFYVSRARKKRYLAIQKALPDVLDLMTICAEAGLSLAAMLDRVSKELQIAYPEMAEELAMTSIELGFLPDRNKALYNLAERCTLAEVRGVVSVLVQTEKYGTPIAQALRVLSTEFRQARMLRAEAKAARLPALMTVPMIVFILPTLFIVIISPAVVKLLDTIRAH